MMTRLGGTIGVASDGRSGTSFVLRLPCSRAESEPKVGCVKEDSHCEGASPKQSHQQGRDCFVGLRRSSQ